MKYGYSVNINQSLESEQLAEEEYGSWEDCYSNQFEKISKAKEIPDVVSDFDIQKGEKCWVVWVEYSSGDSFGMSENCSTEVCGVFRDKKCAQELERAIKEQNRVYSQGEFEFGESWEDQNKFYFKTSDGQEFQYGFCPWYGYFEVLENVYVEESVME